MAHSSFIHVSYLSFNMTHLLNRVLKAMLDMNFTCLLLSPTFLQPLSKSVQGWLYSSYQGAEEPHGIIIFYNILQYYKTQTWIQWVLDFKSCCMNYVPFSPSGSESQFRSMCSSRWWWTCENVGVFVQALCPVSLEPQLDDTVEDHSCTSAIKPLIMMSCYTSVNVTGKGISASTHLIYFSIAS